MNNLRIFSLLLAAFLVASCKSSSPTEGPNDIAGDVNIPINTIGNDFSPTVYLGTSYLNISDSMVITSNANGLIAYKVWANIAAYPALKALLPANRLDASGNLNTTIHLKVTSEGIQDYRLAKSDFSKPFTIVKYSGNVGDSYQYTTADGKTVTRTVTQKSTTDDFGYGFMLIKTMTTNEDNVTDISGVKAIRYITNHKFGLVQIVVVLTDNSQLKITLFPTNY
jgi:hypothetical protein